jgi:uncharacterized protein
MKVGSGVICYLSSMPNMVLYVLIGLGAGVLSGMFGIGGGVVIVPALIFLASMSLREATGTSLAALIPPVGLLGAWEYYRSGSMHVRTALLVAAGLFVGAYLGSRVILTIPTGPAKKFYAVFMVLIGIRMFFE